LSANASWIRSPARHSTTIRPRSRQPWRASPAARTGRRRPPTTGGVEQQVGHDPPRARRRAASFAEESRAEDSALDAQRESRFASVALAAAVPSGPSDLPHCDSAVAPLRPRGALLLIVKSTVLRASSALPLFTRRPADQTIHDDRRLRRRRAPGPTSERTTPSSRRLGLVQQVERQVGVTLRVQYLDCQLAAYGLELVGPPGDGQNQLAPVSSPDGRVTRPCTAIWPLSVREKVAEHWSVSALAVTVITVQTTASVPTSLPPLWSNSTSVKTAWSPIVGAVPPDRSRSRR
jgi:hypothetical protein